MLRRRHDPALQCVVAFAAARFRTFYAALSIITGQREIRVCSVGTEVDEIPRDQAFCAVTIQRPGEALIVPDALRDPRFAGFPSVTGSPFIRFYAGYPIVDRCGYALGALCVADRVPRSEPLDPTDLMIRAREVERLLPW
jgi:GAF domain-containing protein